MAINDGQDVDASNSNAAWASKQDDNEMLGKQTLNRPASGTQVDDVQQQINDNIDTLANHETRIGTNETTLVNHENRITQNESDITDNRTDIDDIRTTTGTADGDTDLGTFTGDIIPDNVAIKPALQSLESKIEEQALMRFKGNWDASTNTPDLQLVTPTEAQVYRVTVAGTTSGLTNIPDATWSVGDWIYWVGTEWARADNVDDVLSVNGKVGIVVLNTDDISEGATNKYYSSALFDADFALKDTDGLTEGSTNLYYTAARFDAAFALKDTDDLAEGTNKYYSTGLFDTDFATKDIEDLSNVGGAAPTDGQVLTYVNANSRYEPKDSAGGGGGGSAAKLIGGGNITWELGSQELFTGGTPNGGNAISTDSEWDAQSFTIPTTRKIKSIDINLINSASGTGTAQIDIHADTAGEPGSVLFSGGGVDLTTIPNVNALYNFPIEADLTGGTTYWLVIRSTGTGGVWNTLVKLDHIASGNRANTVDSGSNWTDLPADDLEFNINYADVVTFDNSFFLEFGGLNYSANTIPDTESGFALNEDKRVAYVTPNDSNPGGNLTVSVGDLADVGAADIVVARRDGDDLLAGDTTLILDGETRRLYDTTSGLSPIVEDQPVTVVDITASTPPTKGTPIVDKSYSTRIGSNMIWHVGYRQTAPGTAGTGTYKLPVPGGLTIDTSKREASTSGTYVLGAAGILGKGGVVMTDDSQNVFIGVDINVSNDTLQFFGSGLFTFAEPNLDFGFTITIPILEWANSNNVLANTKLQQRTIRAKYFVSGASANLSFADNVDERVDFDNKAYDSHDLVTTGAGWTFATEVDMLYDVKALISWATNASLNTTKTYVFVNGVLDTRLSFTGNDIGSGGATAVFLAAGQNISVYANQDHGGGSARTIQSGTSESWISITSHPDFMTYGAAQNQEIIKTVLAGNFSMSSPTAGIWQNPNTAFSIVIQPGTYSLKVKGLYGSAANSAGASNQINNELAFATSPTAGSGLIGPTYTSHLHAYASNNWSWDFVNYEIEEYTCTVQTTIYVHLRYRGFSGSPSFTDLGLRSESGSGNGFDPMLIAERKK